MSMAEKIYYSLDIETSGFDPEKNEILEVGFAGFKVDGTKLKIVERWSQVFRPSRPVSSRVLGLTGISQGELDAGIVFSDVRRFLQERLGGATIVGHNIAFDIRFLEKFGLILSGQTVDTMDLVQIFLPTYHSYNLESLMHYFRLPHPRAHRALADSEAVVRLLERLLDVYRHLPESAEVQLRQLACRAGLAWAGLLTVPVHSKKKAVTPDRTKFGRFAAPSGTGTALRPNTLYLTEAFIDPVGLAEDIAANTGERLLLVVPRRQHVLELWRHGVARGVFSPRYRLNRQVVAARLAQREMTPEEAKFLMKILVWQASNWQADYIVDLNLSFFGGQFRDWVCGGQLVGDFSERVLCCDQETFLEFKDSSLLRNRAVAVLGLADFERTLSSTLGQRSSWGYISYLLKSVYDPGSGAGNETLADLVNQALADTDLFFGLAMALLGKYSHGASDVVVDDYLRSTGEFQKVAQAADHYCVRLRQANLVLKSEEITDFTAGISDFFAERPHYVKWAHIVETTCVFHSLPLDISGVVKERFNIAAKLSFFESCSDDRVLSYFTRRLGFGHFSKSEWRPLPPAGPRLWWQRFWHRQPVCKIGLSFSPSETLTDLLKKQDLPAAVVMDNTQTIGEFYKAHYIKFRRFAFLLAEQAEGGSNKLLRNFTIHSGSLLLITDRSVLRVLRGSLQAKPVDRLGPKTLIFTQLPVSDSAGPYGAALASQFNDPDGDYYLPNALYDFYSLLQFFHTSRLRKIYIYFPKKALKNKEIYSLFLSRYFKVEKI